MWAYSQVESQTLGVAVGETGVSVSSLQASTNCSELLFETSSQLGVISQAPGTRVHWIKTGPQHSGGGLSAAFIARFDGLVTPSGLRSCSTSLLTSGKRGRAEAFQVAISGSGEGTAWAWKPARMSFSVCAPTNPRQLLASCPPVLCPRPAQPRHKPRQRTASCWS